MKIGEVLNWNGALKSIVDDKNVEVSALIKFKMLGMIRKFEPVVADFERIRNEKITEYGTTEVDDDGNETGKVIIPATDTVAIGKFNADLEELLNSDVDIEIDKFKPEEIIDKGISSDLLLRLYNLIGQ